MKVREVDVVEAEEFLRRLYARFNAREMEALLASMAPDVMWANGMEGGHERGREAVRAYWTRQWAMVDPHVEPVGFSEGEDGAVVVEVHQVVKDLAGVVLMDVMLGHVFWMEGGLVGRFDIRGE
jgi:ketosteroid isomerase-like protein